MERPTGYVPSTKYLRRWTMPIIVYTMRSPDGVVGLNGRHYLLDDSNKLLEFETVQDAKTYIIDEGGDPEDEYITYSEGDDELLRDGYTLSIDESLADMDTYEVKINEIWQVTTRVKANSREEAEEEASLSDDGEIGYKFLTSTLEGFSSIGKGIVGVVSVEKLVKLWEG